MQSSKKARTNLRLSSLDKFSTRYTQMNRILSKCIFLRSKLYSNQPSKLSPPPTKDRKKKVNKKASMHACKQTCKRALTHASKHASEHATSKHASKQADKETSKQALTFFSSLLTPLKWKKEISWKMLFSSVTDLLFQFPESWIFPQVLSSATASFSFLADVLVWEPFHITDSLVYVNSTNWDIH